MNCRTLKPLILVCVVTKHHSCDFCRARVNQIRCHLTRSYFVGDLTFVTVCLLGEPLLSKFLQFESLKSKTYSSTHTHTHSQKHIFALYGSLCRD